MIGTYKNNNESTGASSVGGFFMPSFGHVLEPVITDKSRTSGLFFYFKYTSESLQPPIMA